jgi:hypothetical protein
MTKPPLVLHSTDLPHVFRWTRDGRRGQACRVLTHAKDGTCMVEFADGYRMVTYLKSLRRNVKKPGDCR